MRLVLLPGLDGTGELFAPFLKALGSFPCEVIGYPPDRVLDYPGHVAHVRGKLPRDEDFVLLAESFSGPVGISLAATAPPRLAGLILCATFVSNPLPIFGPLRKLIAALPAMKLPPSLMAPWLYAGHATPALRRAHAAAMSRVSAQVIRARVSAILAVDCSAQLAGVAVPMMYLRASLDRLVPAAAGRRILNARPDVELVEFDAPHFLLQTRPEACASAVLEFMRRRT